MQIYDPITLRREQFGLVAFAVMLFAFLPSLLSIPPIWHVLELEFAAKDRAQPLRALAVRVAENGEVSVEGQPVTLLMLMDRVLIERSRKSVMPISFHPDACAPYDVVLKTMAVLKRSAHPDIRLAKPEFTTSFGKANYRWDDYDRLRYGTSRAQSPRMAHFVSGFEFSWECKRKANPEFDG
jgi:biopolymer transport protein ExbD